ncbi:MAG: hypothetical protein F6K00_27135 [Leptolyngbya sp. SIOISBB]|nr:hypothetical protein [Leptolyngbya sp. SIOISBB]
MSSSENWAEGGALTLQATLPPQPTSNRAKPYQQKVYIKKPANLAGLRAAEKLARLLSGQVIAEKFTWEEWGTKFQASSSCSEAIARFEKHYLNQGGSKDTWNGDYWKIYKRLPKTAAVSPDVFTALTEGTIPNTRTRQRTVTALATLAKFSGIDWNGKHLKGSYSPQKTAPRELPDDREIADYRESLNRSRIRHGSGCMGSWPAMACETMRFFT